MQIQRATAIAGALLLSTSLFAQRGIPNTVKYRDSSVPNATGRAGSASIEARALHNKDRSTDLEITTGSFDGRAAVGNIEKVRLALPNGGTRNFNALRDGGTFATRLSGLLPGARIGIQANVSGIDGTRVSVVSASEIVKLRPDLRVSNVDAPAKAIAGVSTTIHALVEELNGDVGARANCRLLAGGVEIDRAEGIWVDAGDTVQCSFMTVFNTPGTIQLTVVVDGVNPGDWDNANNSASVEVLVESPTAQYRSWEATVYEDEIEEYRYEKSSWQERTTDRKGVNQGFRLRGILDDEISHDGLSATMSASSDGQILAEASVSEFFRFNNRRGGGYCSDSDAYPWTRICWDPDWGYTSVDIEYGASNVAFRSWGWATANGPWGPTVPKYYFDQSHASNTLRGRFGTTVSMDIKVSNATTTWLAAPFITSLTEQITNMNQPYRCFYDDFLNDTLCTEVRGYRKSLRGTAHGR